MPKPKEEWANKMTEEIIKDINAIPEMSKIDFEIIGSIKELIRGGLRKYVYELPVELLQEQHNKAIKKTRKETIKECLGIVDNWKRGVTNHNPNDLITRLKNLRKFNE